MLTLPYQIATAARNMAVDLAFLQDWTGEDLPRFRAYGWAEPACTFGQSQKWQEVSRMVEQECQLVRRATGGGLVDHRMDWTWSLVIPASHPAHRDVSSLVYQKAHEAICNALKDFGVEAVLKPCYGKNCSADGVPRPQIAAVCFEKPETYDILTPDGQKIAGAAMKRTRDGLLIQGSLSLTVAGLGEAMLGLFYEKASREIARVLDLGIPRPATFHIPEEALSRHEQLFSSKEWNQRR